MRGTVSIQGCHRLEYYPISPQSRLPAIRIPLQPQDRDVVLRLQPLIAQACQNGRYDDLDYRGQLNPPLAVEESAWAEEWLRSQGKR